MLQEIDNDVAYFVERYGVGTLVAALRGAGLHFAGKRANAVRKLHWAHAVPEHEIGKTDTILAGLAIQYLRGTNRF